MVTAREFIEPKEAAELLAVNLETIYRWLNSGKLPGTKIGGLWRIRRSAIERLINQSERTEEEDAKMSRL